MAELIKSQIYFLEENQPLFSVEKPFAFRYDVEDGDIPQTNMRMHPHVVVIQDIRGSEHGFSLEKNSFEVIKVSEQTSYEDFHHEEGIAIYLRELENILAERLKAKLVKAFRYGIRKRHQAFPVSTGNAYEFDQPTMIAHVDTTPDEMCEQIERLTEEEAALFRGKRCQWVNVWKPLKGPLNDWPLTLCDPTPINSTVDFEAADLLYPDLATENFQVYQRDYYKWYYLRNQKPVEAWVFLQADTRQGASCGVPHCSFDNPLASPNENPRESIEVRLLVCYDESNETAR